MRCKYITIEREYGSGGTRIAALAAGQAGIPCYGREILEEVSRKVGISVDKIESYEETATNSFLYSVYMMSQTVLGNADMLTNDGHIYVAEQAVIQKLAASSRRAIFLGHCASEALKDQQGVINVFIRCTDEEARTRRIVEEYDIPAAQADVVRRRFDRKRANYYYVNTAKKWEDLRNYDMVLDSGRLGIEGCAGAVGALLAD